MTDVRAFLHYFQTIAAQHVHINDFFVMDLQEPLAAFRSEIKFPALILNNLSGKFVSPSLDNVSDEVHGGFLILDHLDNPQDFAAEMLLLQRMKRIGTEILVRINHDLCSEDPQAMKAIEGFNFNSVTYTMVDGVFENCYGFIFSFKVNSMIEAEYDPDRWSSNKAFTDQFQY